jgi:hypothetical protein
LFVVVALYHRAIHLPDEVEAFVRVRVVPDEIAEADVVRAICLLGVGEDRLRRFEVGVEVAENGETHRR